MTNAWSKAFETRLEHGDLADLTESNPTRVGLPRPPPEVLAALSAPEVARYDPHPRGMRSAREAVARDLARRTGVTIDPDSLVLTAGTSEAYAHLFRLLADPGDRVLVPTPSYPLFEPLAALEGLSVDTYPLAGDGRWHLDLAALDDALARLGAERTRAVIVVQPNHPTGSCLDLIEIDELVTRAEARGLALVADEVFGDYPRGTARLPSLLGVTRVPTFVLGGLSKSCGLPQMKLGWILATGPPPAVAVALAGLDWIADTFLTVGTPVQRALPALLAWGEIFRAAARERIALNLERLAALCVRRPELALRPADGGWWAVLEMPSRHSDEEWALALLERSVAAHPGHFYDIEGVTLVLSLICEPAAIDAGIEVLERLLED